MTMEKVLISTKNELSESDTKLFDQIRERFKIVKPHEADAVFVIGGDGAMLDADARYRDLGLPFFGFNTGNVGHYMNPATVAVLDEIRAGSVRFVDIKHLMAFLQSPNGETARQIYALNDVDFERASPQMAHVRVTINSITAPGHERIMADAVIVATPAGSTGYNASVGGPILSIEDDRILVVPAGLVAHQDWIPTVYSGESVVVLEALSPNKRPVRVVADGREIAQSGVTRLVVMRSQQMIRLGFAASHDYHAKIADLRARRRTRLLAQLADGDANSVCSSVP